MFYGDSVQDTRQIFFTSWEKYKQKKPLSPLEQQVVDVIIIHPEYQAILENPSHKDAMYFPELGHSNPFLHMGLHLAIRDQVATDRPVGITTVYQQLLQHYQDVQKVEHMMIEHLAECLWRAQRDNSSPDEIQYLEGLQQLFH
jgi:hypothetical protein